MDDCSTNYLKHTSRNPLQQYLIGRFNSHLLAMVQEASAGAILDAGCGEGFTIKNLQDKGVQATWYAVDSSPRAAAALTSRTTDVAVHSGNIEYLPFADNSFDLVICCEVLEHVVSYDKALSELIRVSRNNCIFSVPHEPYFRIINFLRGKYWSRLGNHPEHVNLWSKDSFIRLLSSYGKLIRIDSPFPWTMALLEK